jgi:hypothetical protein
LGGESAGRPAARSVDLYNVLAFTVGKLYMIKISYSTANNLVLDVMQSGTLISLEYVIFILYVAFLGIEAVNSFVMSAFLPTKP